MSRLVIGYILVTTVMVGLGMQEGDLLDSHLEKCTLNADEKIAEDQFVLEMFKIYKNESKNPPAGSVQDLKNAEGHELLSRLLLFIDTSLHRTITNNGSTKTLGNLTKLSDLYQSEGLNSTTRHQVWPYRCYSPDVLEALDVYLPEILPQIISLIENHEDNIALFNYGLVINLPQFQGYVRNLNKPLLTTLCSLFVGKHNVESTFEEITKVFDKLSSQTNIAQTACSSLYNNEPYCLLQKIKSTLNLFRIDYKRAGKSTVMKKFALLWFFEPSLSNFCSNSSTKASILHSFAASEEKEITGMINGEPQKNYENIRLFIYDHIFNHFTSYLTDNTEIQSFIPKQRSTQKFTGFQKLTYPTQKPKENFLSCFNFFLTTLGQMDAAVEDRLPDKVKALAQVSLLFIIHPDFETNTSSIIREFLKGLGYFVKDTTALGTLGVDLGKCGLSVCHRNSTGSSNFCEISKLLVDLRLLGVSMHSKPSVKILTPLTVEYRQALSQERTWLPEAKRNTKGKKRAMNSFRNDLQKYFMKIGEIAEAKARYYASSLLRMANSLHKRVNQLNLKRKLSILFGNILKSAAPNLQGMEQPLGVAVVDAFNPLKWLWETSSSSIRDVLQKFSQAIAGVNHLVNLFGEAFRQVYTSESKMTSAQRERSTFHKKLRNLFVNLTTNLQVGDIEEHLGISLDNYEPHGSIGDLEERMSLLSSLVESLCDILYGPGNDQPAKTSDCLSIRKDVEVVSEIYQETYEFQFDFMEMVASIFRALITKQSAEEVAKISTINHVNISDLQRSVYKLRVQIQTKVHTHNALQAICEELEYKNGGVPAAECLAAMATQSRMNSEKVLMTTIDECASSQTKTVNVRIPGFTNANEEFSEKGSIDLTALYGGRQTTFKIPFSENLPWFDRFASGPLPASADVAMYLKHFELFLPETTGPTNPKQYDLRIVTHKELFSKPMPSGQIKYGFSDTKVFDLVYGENKETCESGFMESAYPKLCHKPTPVCLYKRGQLPNTEISPPLYGQWSIQTILPEGLPIPKPYPGTSFYLRAVMSVCVSNPKNVNLLKVTRPDSISGSSGECCPDGGFWNIDRYLQSVQFCLQCPVNSAPKLGGLYCHETAKTTKVHKKTHHKKRFFKRIHGSNVTRHKHHKNWTENS